ncbi:hypothetical protein BX616_010153 [Lobosporangium transversale]|uniref:Galactose oxidase n=1 Tax=Lobosporangium transversale TaxID=64571 RepID=A0A1Y2H4Z6_9FUNG|nr:hypothetical protein BCR41DRAFT_418135 [Lobosporangium transversale]KAF9918139.1 hypothetical protein BX616_010153 [Lobosporangium transversale]ORZ29061.1 hypothetical protein BCR41DRAFT_418135 [Lobosporangium transversale]|eukprot:XP_021886734.1 hypothetical protein BCR41DRAFT_418135 [Lobosporangium transversale]
MIYLLLIHLACAIFLVNSHGSNPSPFSPKSNFCTTAPFPRAVWAPAYTVLNDYLYIQGGQSENLEYLEQFYRLDLSKAWKTECPAWEKLRPGPKNFYHTCTGVPPESVLPQNRTLYVPRNLSWMLLRQADMNSSSSFSNLDEGSILTFKATATDPANSLVNRYKLSTARWTSSNVKVLVPRRYGIEAVMDPRSGLVYLLGGYNTWRLDSMTVYDPYSDTLASVPLSTQQGSQEAQVLGLTFFSAAWVTSLQQILYFGGTNDLSPNRSAANIALYSPTENRWTSVTTQGDVPQDIYGACHTIDVLRNRAILFGGSGHGNPPHDSNQIFFLDLNPTSKSMFTWRQGQPASQTRRNMACTAYKQFFIAWGGKVNGTVGGSKEHLYPIVYDLTKDIWVDWFGQPSK